MHSLQNFLSQLKNAGFEISPAVTIEIAKIFPTLASKDEIRLSLRMLICTTKQQQDLFDFIWDVEYRELFSSDDENDTLSSNDGSEGKSEGEGNVSFSPDGYDFPLQA